MSGLLSTVLCSDDVIALGAIMEPNFPAYTVERNEAADKGQAVYTVLY